MPTSWTRLYIAGALVMALAFLGLMAGAGVLIPPLLIIPLLYVIPIVLLLRFSGKRWPGIVGAVLAALVLVAYAPGIGRDAVHPDTFFTFAPVLSATVAAGVMTIAGAAEAMRWRPDLARSAGLAAVAILVVVVLGSLFMQLSLEDDTQQDGDVYVEAFEARFTPKIEAKAGPISIFVENKDRVWHTFSIAELGLDVYVPGATDRRIDVDILKPGTYAYVCLVPEHEGMVGTIEVK